MKISLNWLKKHINITENVASIASHLTQAGLEVAGIENFESIKGGLKGLVIGHIIGCGPHPNADKLKQVVVDIGAAEPLSIICGCPTIAVGKKVVVAPVGTTIYNCKGDPFKIKKAKIRGVISEGMLCAPSEIGISKENEKIIYLNTTLPPGTSANNYFEIVTDTIFEIEITPNRADACSHLGIARDLCAIFNIPLTEPKIRKIPSPTTTLPLYMQAIDAESCPRYTGIVLRNVIVAPSPKWLQDRLQSIGIKPINNIVDVTNYVLHDLGQPLHAFDYDTLVGNKITVKKLGKAHPFTTLDGINRTLTGEELMICDEEGSLCMAGILGGMRGSITAKTKNIFLESGYFNPTIIRQGGQHHGIKTDASFRFERGTDPNNTIMALKYACRLLEQVAHGKIGSELIDHYPQPISSCPVQVKYKHINQLIGHTIPQEEVKTILKNLSITLTKENEAGFTAHVPPYRVDVTREADVIEEIVRIYGYDNIPLTGVLGSTYLANTTQPTPHQLVHSLSTLLTANGYHEICTNSLTPSAYTKLVPCITDKESVPILNPLSSGTNTLRTTLLFSGLEVIAHNIARKSTSLKFFEWGTTYHKKEDAQYEEIHQLGLWITGKNDGNNWMHHPNDVTYQTLHGTIHQLLHRLGITTFTYKNVQDPYFQESVKCIYQDQVLLTAGKLAPQLCNQFKIGQPLFFANIIWDALLLARNLDPSYQTISKFPPVKRDLSLVLDLAITFEQIKDVISQYGGKCIQDVEVFDVYTGDKLAAGEKSYAITLTLQSTTKTLDEKTIHHIMDVLMQRFEKELGARIRR